MEIADRDHLSRCETSDKALESSRILISCLQCTVYRKGHINQSLNSCRELDSIGSCPSEVVSKPVKSSIAKYDRLESH